MQDNIEHKAMKHTTEPWEHEVLEVYSKERLVADCGHIEGDPENISNASRIVACVNALAGIEEPEQWVAMAKSHIDASEAQADQNQRLKAERDNLYVALKELVELKGLKDRIDSVMIADWHDESEYKQRKPPAWEAARKAIQDYEEDNN
jgi:hypothetical protein